MAASTSTASQEPWDVLQREAAACTRCRLHATRSHVVFGEGDPAADLVLVGEAPGRQEDLQGRPFAGAAGNLLDNLLLENGLTRRQVYVCTVVKCRPSGNRQPEHDEVEACSRYLLAQLAHVAPRVVVALGEVAARLLLARELPLNKVAGYRFDVQGGTVIPTYEPTAALRGGPHLLAALRRDVRTATRILDRPAREALTDLCYPGAEQPDVQGGATEKGRGRGSGQGDRSGATSDGPAAATSRTADARSGPAAATRRGAEATPRGATDGAAVGGRSPVAESEPRGGPSVDEGAAVK